MLPSICLVATGVISWVITTHKRNGLVLTEPPCPHCATPPPLDGLREVNGS